MALLGTSVPGLWEEGEEVLQHPVRNLDYPLHQPYQEPRGDFAQPMATSAACWVLIVILSTLQNMFWSRTLLLPRGVVCVVSAQPEECRCSACYSSGEAPGMNQSPNLITQKQMGQWAILLRAEVPSAFWFAGMEFGLLVPWVHLEKPSLLFSKWDSRPNGAEECSLVCKCGLVEQWWHAFVLTGIRDGILKC